MAIAMSEPNTSCVEAFPLQLQLWLSPAFPVGSFAYSHGLEWAAGSGRVHDRETARSWISALLVHGGPRNDAILLAEAWRAVTTLPTSTSPPPALRRGEEKPGASATGSSRLAACNDLALALAGGRERYLEASAQGNAFLATVRAAWSTPAFERATEAFSGDAAYPVAVGAAAASCGIPLEATLRAFLAALCSNLVSALVRLAVFGQTDGQRVQATLAPAIEAQAACAAASTLDDLGGAAFVSDIAALAHETQETRMFRT